MQVIQRIGRMAGEIIDLPVNEAKAMVLSGRADCLPGDEWKFGIEQAVVRQPETASLTQKERAITEPSELRCPHCGTTGKHKGMMKRWHFDNCKNHG